jgi:hypothetical protein
MLRASRHTPGPCVMTLACGSHASAPRRAAPQVSLYTYGLASPPNFNDVGHFTQVRMLHT